MKKLVTILAALAMLLVGTAALAADTATVNVRAQVLGTCQFSTPGPTPTISLDFGNFTVPALADVNVSTPIGVLCTSGVGWNITSAPAVKELSSGALPPIGYNLTITPAANGTGTGALQALSLNGQIPQANLGAGVAAGVYTQTVTLTLNP